MVKPCWVHGFFVWLCVECCGPANILYRITNISWEMARASSIYREDARVIPCNSEFPVINLHIFAQEVQRHRGDLVWKYAR